MYNLESWVMKNVLKTCKIIKCACQEYNVLCSSKFHSKTTCSNK